LTLPTRTNKKSTVFTHKVPGFDALIVCQVERAKRQLSTTHQQRIEIEAFFDGKDLSEVRSTPVVLTILSLSHSDTA
jgi:hypothetical protein